MTKLLNLPVSTVALAATIVFCAACGSVGSDVSSHDVKWVGDNRAALAGQRVVMEGFLLRDGDYYFVSQGKQRPAGQTGVGGETYACNFTGAPTKIWFKKTAVSSGERWNFPNELGVGRHVVLSATLTNETSGEPKQVIDAMSFGPADLAEESFGPLRDVKLVKLLDERCSGSDY